MNKLATLALLLSAPYSHAEIRWIELLPGYQSGAVSAMSDDGTVLGIDMLMPDTNGTDSFRWADGSWASMPRLGLFNLHQGMSGDGSAALTLGLNWGDPAVLTHTRDGVRTILGFADPTLGRAALSSDGSTAFYSVQGPSADPRIQIERWSERGTTEILARLDAMFVGTASMLGTDREDLVVVTGAVRTDEHGANGSHRVTVVGAGHSVIIPTLTDAEWVHAQATGVSRDGSVIVGLESSRDGAGGPTFDRSWIARDGVVSELLVAGIDALTVTGLTDDGLTMVGGGLDASGVARSFLLHADGRTEHVEDLLAAEGFTLAAGQRAMIHRISGDGTVIAGSIDTFIPGESFTSVLFTLTVPAPGGSLLLAGVALVARRRR
jgi:hypothetical protein